ncbi:ferrochelatase [Paenibacillus thiaminolyticus]|uniref:ferrochelatase n=1 Tax=Paenibacillus thiaminolyticus TaxID=49283 RepID=UPI0035A5820B
MRWSGTDWWGEIRLGRQWRAEEAEIGRWDIAYRSGLPAPQRWLGPDVKDVIRQAAGHGCQAVVLCELTSLTDNVEVYHDLGEDAKRLAEACGMQFVRTEPVNDAWTSSNSYQTLSPAICSPDNIQPDTPFIPGSSLPEESP